MNRIGGVLIALTVLFGLSCKNDAIGPVNGVLVVSSPSLSDFIDEGALDDLQLVVETVDPEDVFSFTFVGTADFDGDLRRRRVILLLLDPSEKSIIPAGMTEDGSGIYTGSDVWALNQQVFAVVVDPAAPELPSELPAKLEEAYNTQMRNYIYESFVSTSMTSPERMDSLSEMGFVLDIPKSYAVRIWRPEDGFVQYQRQPDDNTLILFSIRILNTDAELTPENAILAREAMARLFFYDASADSVDRSRVESVPISVHGLSGWQLTGVWRNSEHLNAGAFTSRVFAGGDVWYILDLEVYSPGTRKEQYLREGWIIMDTFSREG